MLSVIIPAYNEELMIEKATVTIHQILSDADIEHELWFIDDGSRDKTWERIRMIAEQFSCVHGVHFSRNFGKEAAIMAGLHKSRGDCCVVIDCDLQMPPEKILDMYRLWLEGYEIVEGRKRSRGKETVIYSWAAGLFYEIIDRAAGFDLKNSSDFKLLDRRAVNVLINMNEKNAFFRALSSWIGFRTTEVYFDVQERLEGESKWSAWSLVKYALSNISSFSTAPMQLITVLGVIMLFLSVILGITALVQKIQGIAEPGFTTVIILLLFSSSIIMISLGIIGYYIARIYEEIQGRPRYIISEECE